MFHTAVAISVAATAQVAHTLAGPCPRIVEIHAVIGVSAATAITPVSLVTAASAVLPTRCDTNRERLAEDLILIF